MKLLRFWPVSILLFAETVLFLANYAPGTWLMGWDNVMPEFNFKENFMRSLFGIWQEHRGLGLYDGMGHAANLVHTIFLWLLSLTLPRNLLRYIFHFLMHLLGGIGAYVLLKKLINNKTVALAGAIFYLFNLATIQMFYTPLEAFSVHFASLPWIAWSFITYLQEGSRKRFLVFLLISLLSTPQFFIPTLLLPVGILLGSITLFTFTQESVLRTQDTLLKKPITAFVGFLLINAFWLLPYLYGVPRNAPVIQSAKINQMSSEEVFARNQAFGGLGDVLRLRGFPLDFEDVAADGTTIYLMAPWQTFLDQPLVTTASWLLVGIVLVGIVSFARPPLARLGGFVLTFFIAFVFLANDTPGIKEFTTMLYAHIPFFAEAYRFPFTKFSLLLALSSSVLFVIGFTRIAKTRTVPIIAIGLILMLALPVFRGHFFSERLRVALPDDYQRIFSFMKKQPMGRVAYLPQHQYWSWKYYQWGYRGSGFLWYGIENPILDRSFDPWSGANENYYWEISRSIYSKDVAAFDAALNKYDVRYILLDENLISPSHNRALFTEEIKTMLGALPTIRETARFGKITLYERPGDDTQSFVSLKTDLPTVSPAYAWTDNDVAYRELGDYIAISEKREAISKTGHIYPFRSLFTKRSVDEREFAVSDIPIDALVYDSTKSADLVAENVKPCGVLRDGTATAQNIDQFLHFTSRNQRGCLSFGVPNLPHRDGYLVAVESRHITGRPMLFSLINQTAKHVELETYLESSVLRPTSYFILPPLASDGLGYTVYLSNDAIGGQETINDIKSIKFYRIPYQKLVTMKTSLPITLDPAVRRDDTLTVDHPNPAYYRITLNPIPQTLPLSSLNPSTPAGLRS